MFTELSERVPALREVVVSVRCHDELGLAVANSLGGLQAGARQVKCAINGLGERAGNASLEEFVMLLHTRSRYLGLTTGIDTTEIARTSRLVSRLTGNSVQPNKAIVAVGAGFRGVRPDAEHRVQAVQGARGQEEAGDCDGS